MPAAHTLTLHLLSQRLAVCRLPAHAPIPEWATSGPIHAITRTPYELSIVCDQAFVPPAVQQEGPWRCLEVAGPLDFALTGILADLATPLADAGIPIFAVSTYRTDYILIPADKLQPAIIALRSAGHTIREDQR